MAAAPAITSLPSPPRSRLSLPTAERVVTDAGGQASCRQRVVSSPIAVPAARSICTPAEFERRHVEAVAAAQRIVIGTAIQVSLPPP
jgi:hypothetical protein